MVSMLWSYRSLEVGLWAQVVIRKVMFARRRRSPRQRNNSVGFDSHPQPYRVGMAACHMPHEPVAGAALSVSACLKPSAALGWSAGMQC